MPDSPDNRPEIKGNFDGDCYLAGQKDVRNGIEMLRVFMTIPGTEDPEKRQKIIKTLKNLIKYNLDYCRYHGRSQQYWIKEAAQTIRASEWHRELGWWNRFKLRLLAKQKIRPGKKIPEFKEKFHPRIKELLLNGEYHHAVRAMDNMNRKVKLHAARTYEFSGRILAVQPRINLTRSFTEQYHQYKGYNLKIDGIIDEGKRKFAIAVGPGAHRKHGFCRGIEISGCAQPVKTKHREHAEFYKVSKIKTYGKPEPDDGPPTYRIPPALEIYRERGMRPLDPKTYTSKCRGCQWGSRMPVELIIDHWDFNKPGGKKHRYETFCYGPKSCELYQAGPPRLLLGRSGERMLEPDWIYENATARRGPDD